MHSGREHRRARLSLQARRPHERQVAGLQPRYAGIDPMVALIRITSTIAMPIVLLLIANSRMAATHSSSASG
jgi:hypothetical protein